MFVQLHFVQEDIRTEVPEGTDLLQAMVRAGLNPDAPCGGRGTCGKCQIDIRRDAMQPWQRVQACRTQASENMQIRTLAESKTHVLTQGQSADTDWEPWVEMVSLQVPPCSVGESVADWTRLTAALERATGRTGWRPNVVLAAGLGKLLKKTQGSICAAVFEKEVLGLWEAPREVYMAALDLGTTTLAGYLVGRQGILARVGMPNPQTQYGADVIQRADYAMTHGTEVLSGCIRAALDGLLGRLCAQGGIEREDVLAVSLVGNTCMHHLFLGLSPDSLACAPYNPAMSQGLMLRCGDWGLRVHSGAPLLVLPVMAGFVGADTVGCLVAGQWQNREKLTLLIDIGTNGELVLGNRHRRIACSTAAGPAFEGALISCGMRGAEGAVDHVWLENGKIRHSVIGGTEARGICGSGLLDFVAVLLQTGQLDESGALEEETAPLPGTELFLTRRDIRQVQLAKAAICAGIRLMALQLGVALEEIEEVCMAGAFGNFLKPESACAIGLIPRELLHKLRPVGNAAGEGAALVLRRRELWSEALELARQTEFLELATVREFQDVFVDALEFPEPQE